MKTSRSNAAKFPLQLFFYVLVTKTILLAAGVIEMVIYHLLTLCSVFMETANNIFSNMYSKDHVKQDQDNLELTFLESC